MVVTMDEKYLKIVHNLSRLFRFARRYHWQNKKEQLQSTTILLVIAIYYEQLVKEVGHKQADLMTAVLFSIDYVGEPLRDCSW